MVKVSVPWNKLDGTFSLPTDDQHEITVQREVIPLIFVPGIMGSKLWRKAGAVWGPSEKGLENNWAENKLGVDQDLRWNPGSTQWMIRHFLLRYPALRKRMLIGDHHDPDYLEVRYSEPPRDGFDGLMEDYIKGFLKPILREENWMGPLDRFFIFPVYGFGYNWTNSNKDSGDKLATRIGKVIDEGKKLTGLCEKVILLTHSMGGLVARSACHLSGAESKVLGVIHCVQPANGAAAAYWRMKGGFEAPSHGFLHLDKVENTAGSWTLGSTGREVTPLLGVAPGGLQLLPNNSYVTNSKSRQWLKVTYKGKEIISLPTGDPYTDIYSVAAQPDISKLEENVAPSNNRYWGLVDPALLDPTVSPSSADEFNQLDGKAPVAPVWDQFLTTLAQAKGFHTALNGYKHTNTLSIHGEDHKTADAIELKLETSWVHWRNYPERGFHGYLNLSDADLGEVQGAKKTRMVAVLQDPAGNGDGTVPVSSASALDAPTTAGSGQRATDGKATVEHQPAYGDAAVQAWVKSALLSMCRTYYEEHRGAL